MASDNGDNEQPWRTFSLDRLHETPVWPGQRYREEDRGRAEELLRNHRNAPRSRGRRDIQALGAYFCRRTFLRLGECTVSSSACLGTAGGWFMARWGAWARVEEWRPSDAPRNTLCTFVPRTWPWTATTTTATTSTAAAAKRSSNDCKMVLMIWL